MNFTDADRTAFVAAWVTACEKALEGEDFNGGHIYAVSLGSLYAETSGVIRMPGLSASTIESLTEDHGVDAIATGQALYDVKWNPADWRWADIELAERPAAVISVEQQFNSLRGLSEPLWARLHASYIDALIEICVKLYRRAIKRIGTWENQKLAPNFVVFVHEDSEQGIDYLRRSTTSTQLKTLWPPYAK
jgi:hypothetical protein